jgi:probable phosphomutase (TIGR03848 family)
MTLLFLIRHATNDWVGQGLAGWLPGVHLNERGRHQARDLALRLGEIPFAAIYSSPLERAVETAEAIADPRGLKVRLHTGLGEVRYGDWEGKTLAELEQTPQWAVLHSYPSGMQFPNGDSLRQVQARVVSALDSIMNDHPLADANVVIVSHGSAIQLALAHYAGVHLDLSARLTVGPASISVVAFNERGPRLLRMNDTGPFDWPLNE